MVMVAYRTNFEKTLRKIKDSQKKAHVKAQITKIINNPETGKPLRYCRKNTREEYIPPYRLSYCYNAHENTLVFLVLYHKDEQ